MTGLKGLGLSVLVVVLTACASGSHVLTGTPRDAIEPSQVKVYSQAPSQAYDTIASVQASSSQGVSQQGRMDSAVEELKIEAAKLGANGVIISHYPNNSGGVSTQISTGIFGGSRGISTGVGTGFTINPATVKGTAIYVRDGSHSSIIQAPQVQ